MIIPPILYKIPMEYKPFFLGFECLSKAEAIGLVFTHLDHCDKLYEWAQIAIYMPRATGQSHDAPGSIHRAAIAACHTRLRASPVDPGGYECHDLLDLTCCHAGFPAFLTKYEFFYYCKSCWFTNVFNLPVFANQTWLFLLGSKSRWIVYEHE